MTIIRELLEAGQSVWLDYIHKGMLDKGELAELIEADGLTGITSNPSIFEKSITTSSDYNESIEKIVAGKADISVSDLFNHLAVDDIRRAADCFRATWEESKGINGYVSIEVSPELAFDAEGTVKEAKTLFEWIGRPNIMIKVPGTEACLPAITELLSEGIPVNVTLLFSVERYKAVVDAHVKGLEARLAKGESLEKVASVASFFISRVDSAVDSVIESNPDAVKDLMGKAAIANAKLAYAFFQKIYQGDRFKALSEAGAQVQRLLWASTSTKNPAYPDTLYVDELIGPDTVNTIPPATYDAFKDHGTVAQTLTRDIEKAPETIEKLSRLGIDIEVVTTKLENDGIKAFQESFRNLLDSLQQKKDELG